MNIKNIFRVQVLLTLALALVISSCATKKKKATATDGNQPNVGSTSNNEAADLSSIELMADSDSGKAGALRTVNFAFNSSSLSSSAKNILQGNADFLKANPSVDVQVEGHCDERGGREYNIALGERRAKTVKSYLSALGVSSSRIKTISYGKERPIAFGHDESSWASNRRGNFVVTKK